MIIDVDEVKFFVNKEPSNKSKKTVVFLHGFTGSSLDWNFLMDKLPSEFEPITIDLLGHGKTSSPKSLKKYSVQSQIELLDKIFKKLNIVKPILVGYSMGGRLALSYLFSYPQNVEAVILESTSFGLKTKAEKEERIKSDKILANKIMSSSIKEFIDYWMNFPLFYSQKKLPLQIRNEQTENKKRINNVIGLTNSLLGFGTGRMDNYFNELEKIKIKTLLLTGSIDSKFTEIAKEANNLLPNSNHEIIRDAGHNVHLEKPEEFLKLLNSFLLKNIKN